MYHTLKKQSHLKALVSAASESNSTDADVHPAASLADAKNNTLTVSGAISIELVGEYPLRHKLDLDRIKLMFSGDTLVIFPTQLRVTPVNFTPDAVDAAAEVVWQVYSVRFIIVVIVPAADELQIYQT